MALFFGQSQGPPGHGRLQSQSACMEDGAIVAKLPILRVKIHQKFKERVRELTSRTLGVSVPQLIAPLARYLIGWRGYFGFCQTPIAVRNLDAWIRRRLRMYIWRQWKNGRTRYARLRRLGVSHVHAAVAAGAR